jgi:lipopolysaccharide transport system permease protein
MNTDQATSTLHWKVRRIHYLRDLLRELVVRDIKLRYNRSILGVAWSLLVPLAELGILSFVFGTVLPLNVPHFTSYLFSGLLPWAWFSSSLLAATLATRQHKDLLQQVGFPAGILPIITITSQFIHFLLALPILFMFLWIDGIPITFAIAALPAIMALQFAFTLGLAYFLAPLEALFHDTHHVLSLALSLMFYLSPVFYQASAIPPDYSLVYNFNPLVHILGAYRAVLIGGTFPPAGPLLIVGGVSAIMVVSGYRFYMHLHYRMIQEC